MNPKRHHLAKATAACASLRRKVQLPVHLIRKQTIHMSPSCPRRSNINYIRSKYSAYKHRSTQPLFWAIPVMDLSPLRSAASSPGGARSSPKTQRQRTATAPWPNPPKPWRKDWCVECLSNLPNWDASRSQSSIKSNDILKFSICFDWHLHCDKLSLLANQLNQLSQLNPETWFAQ